MPPRLLQEQRVYKLVRLLLGQNRGSCVRASRRSVQAQLRTKFFMAKGGMVKVQGFVSSWNKGWQRAGRAGNPSGQDDGFILN